MNIERPEANKGEGEGRWTPERINAFWGSIEETVKQNILLTFGSTFERRRQAGYGDAEIQESTDRMVAREQSFVTSVLERMQEATSAGRGESILLFDIDETIGTPDFPDDKTHITILRPSLLPLLKEISSPGLQIGFLSSRGKEAIEQQLDDPQHLASVRQYINPAHIYSSRGIVVDDFSYPKYLDTRKGFYGVALREKDGAFFKP